MAHYSEKRYRVTDETGWRKTYTASELNTILKNLHARKAAEGRRYLEDETNVPLVINDENES